MSTVINAPGLKVIDVSKHQGVIDWSKVKADGVEGVIIRAGYGQNTVDDRFIYNITQAIKYNIRVGIYWFIYASNNTKALNNAKKCVDTIKPYKSYITLGVYSDWEYDSDNKAPGQTKKSRTEFVRIFNQYVTDAGYKCGTYTNIDYIKNKFDWSVLSKWDLWLADYSGECDYPCIMRQYSSKGTVNGIKGNVDMNVYFTTPQSIKTEVNNVKIELSVLKLGSKGEEVKTVQRLLQSIGYKGKNGKALTIDGDFGTNTEYAVKNYQSFEGLQPDGVVGAKTWEHILK